MNSKHLIPLILAASLIAACVLPAHAAPTEPMNALKAPIEEGIAILRDPAYAAPERKAEQREKIWETIHPLFDFRVISMRALARYWRDFNDQQQQAFTEAFKELLKNNYLTKLQGNFQNEQIRFDGQRHLSERKALVQTTVLRENVETPIEYSMFEKDGQWFIYDINIEGVSLITNYRTQFGRILAKNSPEELIRRIEKKNKELTSGAGNSDLE